jgi:hypothetical protein
MKNFFSEIKTVYNAPGSSREVRQFGMLIGGIFLVLAFSLWWKHSENIFLLTLFLLLGAVFSVFGAFTPGLLRLPYRFWMTLSFILGFLVSHILLAFLFFFLLTPLGLLSRLHGKRKPEAETSYWKPARVFQKENMEKLF